MGEHHQHTSSAKKNAPGLKNKQQTESPADSKRNVAALIWSGCCLLGACIFLCLAGINFFSAQELGDKLEETQASYETTLKGHDRALNKWANRSAQNTKETVIRTQVLQLRAALSNAQQKNSYQYSKFRNLIKQCQEAYNNFNTAIAEVRNAQAYLEAAGVSPEEVDEMLKTLSAEVQRKNQ